MVLAGKDSKLTSWCGFSTCLRGGKVIDILNVNTEICQCTFIAVQEIHKIFMTLVVSGK